MTTGIEFVDNVDAVKALLANAAPSFDGEKNLARNDAPNRYVWVYDSISGQPAQGTGGLPPRVLSTDVFRVAVHCWGETLAHALYLRSALATALRKVYGGGNNYRMTDADLVGDRAHTQNGFAVVAKIDIAERLLEVDLAKCGPCMSRLSSLTGRATTFEIESPDAEQGDGWIDAKEP